MTGALPRRPAIRPLRAVPAPEAGPEEKSGTSTPTQVSQRWTTVIDGRQLRRLRRQRGLSQEQLAGRAGISLTTIRRLEHQPAAPCRTRTLGRLSAALAEEPARLTPATPS